MGYFKMITESQTWICPKTANYQVICVAGGYCGTSTNVTDPVGGATTSFGSFLSVSGGLGKRTKTGTTPINGYCLNGNLYGTVSSVSSAKAGGSGYGAGGCQGSGNIAQCGNCGDMNMGEYSISQGESVICTVGDGGINSEANQNTTYINGTKGVIIIREV